MGHWYDRMSAYKEWQAAWQLACFRHRSDIALCCYIFARPEPSQVKTLSVRTCTTQSLWPLPDHSGPGSWLGSQKEGADSDEARHNEPEAVILIIILVGSPILQVQHRSFGLVADMTCMQGMCTANTMHGRELPAWSA